MRDLGEKGFVEWLYCKKREGSGEVKARIMIVDDAAFMRAILKDILIELDYEIVAEGSNGQEAVNMYKRIKPDLVTMDITMPEIRGGSLIISKKQLAPKVAFTTFVTAAFLVPYSSSVLIF
ncbi:response regulator [Paenibacillus sp.]|uniref:response regulator n=1 Tax=Paenibacillus sp. TaxID=58172 RepID=UPI0028ACE66A|nr:response regulator [Paenibacillus sp.]